MRSLILGVKQGDPEAVKEFYQKYSPGILNLLKSRLRHAEDAEEILNDVFLAAIDELHFFRGDSSINTWLYRIASNKIIDFYRKKKIKSVILSQAPFLEIIANEFHQPEFQFEKDKIRDKIEKAFINISEKYRKILKLHYEDQIPVKELAEIFALSFKATESLLFRARKSFLLAYERA